MSSKKAMKLAQKQAYARHRSNITNSKFSTKKTTFSNKLDKKNKKKLAFTFIDFNFTTS